MQESISRRIASIADSFSLECLSKIGEVHTLDLQSWSQQIKTIKPGLLVVTSSADAWKLNRSELLQALEHTKKQGIIIVFVSINEEISDQVRALSSSIYELPMSFQAMQEDPSAITLYRRRLSQLIMDQQSRHTDRKGVSVITCSNREHAIENVFANYCRQDWEHKELIIILNNDAMDIVKWRKKADECSQISVYQIPEESNLGACLNFGVTQAKYDYIAKLDDDDYYGTSYLTDMMHAFRESNADIIGKKAFFIYFENSQRLALKYPDVQNQFTSHLVGATLVIKKNVFDHVLFRTDIVAGSDAKFLTDCLNKGYKLYASDKYNYACIRKSNLNEHTWKIKEYLLMHGCTLINYNENFESSVTI